MKKLFCSIILIFPLLLLLVGTALADPPSHDSYVDINQPTTNFDSQDLSVVGSTSGCTATNTAYMQWDLSGISNGQSVTVATLVLTATNPVSVAGTEMISLYETTDGWTESALNNNNAPAVGTLIQSVSAPTAAGQTITFNDANLVSYIDTEASGDDVASFAIRMTGTCNAAISVVRFEDKESGNQGPNLETTPPLAVTLATFGAISQPDHVLVDWATVAEQDNLGFNVLRSTSAEGGQVAINPELIPSQAPGSGQGASYSFEDSDVEDGTTYYYWLQDVDTGGTTGQHGPVSVTYESNATAVDVSTLGAESRWGEPWTNGLLGTLLLAGAVGYVWHRRRRA